MASNRLVRWLRAALPRGVVGVTLMLLALGSPPPATAAVLPAGFTDELIASVGGPTALDFTPDGRLLVATQAGLLRVYSAGGFTLIRNALDLTSVICSNEERGLLGLAVDPQFGSNRYLYLYYSFKKGGICPDGDVLNPDNPVNRVSRFVLQDNNRVLTTTETVLVDNIPTVDGDHNGGDLKFGQDGYLYVSIGDNDCNYQGGPCGGGNEAARDSHILLGKILRITRDGGMPPDNPFRGTDSDRCHLTGRTSPGRHCQETYAWGLRNPFRMAFDPNAAGTRFFINDVGQRGWEEIDLGQAGADYGWNCREGAHTNSTSGKCSPTPANMVDPIYEYGRGGGCASITGGAFVPNGLWPAQYDGKYLFSDYVCGTIFQLAETASGTYTATTFATGLGSNSAVSLLFGPYGSSQALYYTTYAGGGQVRRLAYSQAPVADISAEPTSGAVPLLVNFSGAGSQNPAGGSLTYDWDFGDGTTLLGQTSATTSHTYTANGVYTATLVVASSGGLVSAPSHVVIAAGNSPPAPTIQQPAASLTFSVGQSITLQGQATDVEDGTLPGTALDWEVRLHHVDVDSPGTGHWHPHASVPGTASASFTAPAPEDLGATALSFVEVRLTATDSGGLSTTVTRTVEPKRTNVTFDTVPSGLRLTVNAETFTTPRTVVMWPGWVVEVEAPDSQTDDQENNLVFEAWSNGDSRLHIFTVPEAAAAYTAHYAGTSPSVLLRLWLPLLRR